MRWLSGFPLCFQFIIDFKQFFFQVTKCLCLVLLWATATAFWETLIKQFSCSKVWNRFIIVNLLRVNLFASNLSFNELSFHNLFLNLPIPLVQTIPLLLYSLLILFGLFKLGNFSLSCQLCLFSVLFLSPSLKPIPLILFRFFLWLAKVLKYC